MKTSEFKKIEKPVIKSSYELNEGDVFEHPGLGKVAFIRMKSAKGIVATVLSNGKDYRLGTHFGAKFTIIGEVTIEKIEIESEIDQLRKSPMGTLFVIENRKAAELFKLTGFSPSGKIKAVNPLTNLGFNIDQSFKVKLVSNIK